MKRLPILLIVVCSLCCGQTLIFKKKASGGGGTFNGFAHKMSLTVDHTKVGSDDRSNFTVMYSATVSQWATAGNGGQIRNTVTQTGGCGITVLADFIITSDSGCTTPVA